MRVHILAFTRVGGNKKGIFTRDRQPKMAAHHVRRRYHALSIVLDGAQIPNDVEDYISDDFYAYYSQHSSFGLS